MKRQNSNVRHKRDDSNSCHYRVSNMQLSCQGTRFGGVCTFLRALPAFPLPVPFSDLCGYLDAASLATSLKAPALGHRCHDLRPYIHRPS